MNVLRQFQFRKKNPNMIYWSWIWPATNCSALFCCRLCWLCVHKSRMKFNTSNKKISNYFWRGTNKIALFSFWPTNDIPKHEPNETRIHKIIEIERWRRARKMKTEEIPNMIQPFSHRNICALKWAFFVHAVECAFIECNSLVPHSIAHQIYNTDSGLGLSYHMRVYSWLFLFIGTFNKSLSWIEVGGRFSTERSN